VKKTAYLGAAKEEFFAVPRLFRCPGLASVCGGGLERDAAEGDPVIRIALLWFDSDIWLPLLHVPDQMLESREPRATIKFSWRF
jgi:hypothetical protein